MKMWDCIEKPVTDISEASLVCVTNKEDLNILKGWKEQGLIEVSGDINEYTYALLREWKGETFKVIGPMATGLMKILVSYARVWADSDHWESIREDARKKGII